MASLPLMVIALALAVLPEPKLVDLQVNPAIIRLTGPRSHQLILVRGTRPDGRIVDMTRRARYRSLAPGIASVDPEGFVRSVADGRATIVVEADGSSRKIEVRVEGSDRPRRFNFENDIVPVLSKLGCNASGCHGKAEGQNGFKLSVFGFDPRADYDALTRESRGRRIFPAAPEHSLILTKMTGKVAHGGGSRTSADSEDYRTLRDWIAAGFPFGNPDDPKVVSVRIEPRERQLEMRQAQQLRVTALYSDDSQVDVTAHARFQSNNEGLASVDSSGLITAGETPGDVAVMAAYMGAVDVFQALIPRPGRSLGEPTASAGSRFSLDDCIDGPVLRKLTKLNIEPSGLCTDAEYLRRAYLDVIGTLPTPEESRRFLSDSNPDRRAALIDELLSRPEYVDYWTLKWADLLRVDRDALGHKRAFLFYRWLHDQVTENLPVDLLARAIIIAEGPLDEVGPANFFKAVTKPGEAAGSLSQIFLGVRIGCAECHHHPFDRWAQDDYYGMQAFFAPLDLKPTPLGEAVLAVKQATANNPRTGRRIEAHPLGVGDTKPAVDGDPRIALADWIVSPTNPYFARHLANRYWAHFLGRGVVEPVDDVRDTNPPSNPELLDSLAKIVVDSRFDAKSLIRAIAGSATYQRSPRPNPTNLADEQNYSRAKLRLVEAEVLFDMICQTTGVAEKFARVMPGTRAIQLWDSRVNHYFLRLFGRPTRTSACECERTVEPGVSQVLHLLNAPAIDAKLTHETGTIARLVRRISDDPTLADELYLTFLSRLPTPDERRQAVEYLASHRAQRRNAAEDLAWSLMNSLEFLFNH